MADKFKAQRDLAEVVERIYTVAPELKAVLGPAMDLMGWGAPEMAYLDWQKVADILTTHAAHHPRAADIARIFAGGTRDSTDSPEGRGQTEPAMA